MLARATAVAAVATVLATGVGAAGAAPSARLTFTAISGGSVWLETRGLDGSAPQRLPRTDDAILGAAAWSPDGRWLAHECGNYALCLSSADGSDRRALTDTGDWSGRFVFDLGPAWSADGRWVAFASNRGGGYDIYAVRSDGSDLHKLGGTANPDLQPQWSPDGKQLAFLSIGAKGTADVFSIAADGSGVRQLTNDGADYNGISWSPDGTQLVVSRTDDESTDLFTIAADGRPLRQITHTDTSDELDPAWSPDGSAIAFSADDSAISTIAPDGTQERRVATGPGFRGSPSWQPDASGAATVTAPAAPAPAADSQDARVFTLSFAWTVSLQTSLFSIMGPRAAMQARHVRAAALRALRAVAALRPTTPLGRELRLRARAAFTAVARAAHELVLFVAADRKHHDREALKHIRKATQLLGALDKLQSAEIRALGLYG